ncbi:MAG: VPLPA-CTERM sorting domain-containing protein [Oceanospirillales bacterium]|nr:MAG: VPLPA-CTERM sorting domain-containing protein [Oceanospirillales bacterium]
MHTYYEAFKLKGISFSTMEVSEVPLPAAAWLFLTGLAGMTWMKKRKQKRNQLQAA